MTRPCFLIVDREYGGTISTRKLVLETAKLNVITAYSGQEAIETMQRFPAVDGIVLNASVPDIPCPDLVSELKRISPDIPVVVIGMPLHPDCPGADHILDTFEPAKLLNLLGTLVPKVAEVRAAEERNARAERE